ncbi:hypothetical protein vseg_013661 [Gypsophila vaccaria]
MNTNMIKRKRLDARSFRDWHMSNAKKRKGFSPSAPVSMDRDDKLEASSSMKGNCDPDNFHSQQPREYSDSKSQPDNREATPEQDGCIVPNGSAQSSSSKDMNVNGKMHVETMDEVTADNPEELLFSGESGSDSKRKEKIEGESKFKGSPVARRSSRFIEYWVPVGLSYLQLEKYCEILIQNWMILCAKNKHGAMNLHDILVRGRECCDHPYLVDSSLERFVNDARPVADILTTGIEASGKLALLDKFLHEVKGKGLRVVIVYQSNPSKSGVVVELRHLLDDMIRQRFSEESYVHIYRDFDRSNKRAACDLFNDKKTGRFVMLMERYSCQSNIKLSSVDYVILFNSDWCPFNDLKCLQKMSIQSTGDHFNVLRLYSSNTLEEKVLTLAKEGSPLESNMTNFNYNVSHMLLLWGSSYLFSKLDDFHGHCSSAANLNHMNEEKLLRDVFDELLMLSSCQYGKEHNFSLISKVPEGNGGYPASILIHGEQDALAMDDDIPPCAIWSSLLEERNPQWLLLPKYSKNKRRRDEFSAKLAHCAEGLFEDDPSTGKKTPSSQDKMQSQRSKSRNVTRLAPERKSGDLVGNPISSDVGKEISLSEDGYNVTRRVEETCMQRMRDLLLKQKNEIREFYQAKVKERAKLEEEHQLELDLINQGCRPAGAKKEEVKRLHHIYGKKIEEHKRQMDMKRKELEDIQCDSRIKEQQVKDKLIAFSQTKHFKGRISSLVNESLLNSNLGPANLSENAIDAPNTVSDPAVFSKNKHSEGIGQGFGDDHVQRHDPETRSDSLHQDTEILILEFDDENDAESVPREAVSNTVDNNICPHLPQNTSSLSEKLVEKTSQNMQPEPNCEIEGNSSTNIEHHTETVQGITVDNQSYRDIHGDFNILPECPVSGPLESDGENEVMMLATEEAVDHGSNLRTSNDPEQCALSGQNHLEQVSNFTTILMLDRDGSMDASGGASNGEICCRSNEELVNSATFNGFQGAHQQVLTELPSSRAISMSPTLQTSQIFTTVDDPLPLEQPNVSACPPCNEVRRSPEASTAYNSQISEMPGSSQFNQNQFPLRSPSYNPPLLHSLMQSFVGRDQTRISRAAYPTTTQPANSYFPDVSSLRSNPASPPGIDPLEIELMRMQKVEEEARMIHEEKIFHVKSACEKEIGEVRKKYDLLRQEADVEYLQKNVALESFRSKVESNKVLADTLKYHYQRAPSPIVSQEAIISAIRELPLLRQYNMHTRSTAAANATPTAAQVQVVHQLSELMSVEPVRLQFPSPAPLYPTLGPSGSHLARAPSPHLCANRPLASPTPMSHVTSLMGVPNQVTRWTRPYLRNVVRAHQDGSPSNPVAL